MGVFCLHAVCAPSAYKVYGGQRRAAYPLRQVTGSELPCGSWELKPGPMQQQQVLLTPKPSLQPYFDKFWGLFSVVDKQVRFVFFFLSVLPSESYSLVYLWIGSPALYTSSLPCQPKLCRCSCYLTSCTCVTAFLCMTLEAELYWVLGFRFYFSDVSVTMLVSKDWRHCSVSILGEIHLFSRTFGNV